MSHLVTIKAQIKDATAIAAACQRLGLPAPVEGTAKLYSGEASGLLVQLPGWTYPLVIDMVSGTVQFDHYEGRWGEMAKLHQFRQMYAVERCRQEARAKGHAITETPLPDGSIKLQLIVNT
jgi:hypothetical protein